MKEETKRLLMGKNTYNENSTVYRPSYYRIHRNNEESALHALVKNTPGIMIFDHIESQLTDLVRVLHPTLKFDKEAYEEYIHKHLNGCDKYEYGVWVFYPWSNKLVHLLDEDEFVKVRTNRNTYKITPEEKTILSQKKVGVLGLSVGQSVAVTMAMERCFGELRLADFDVLELTNYNRIRTSLNNLGLNKSISVAREIAEIDPYLNVKCFTQGLREDTMDEFFLAGGKLDLLIEETDSFDMKIICRYKARSLQIPVVMEASDRGTLDVERFDLEPARPILHGLVEDLDVRVLKQLKTTEEKIPYMMRVLGIEQSSTRLKASMLEIDQTINTWPQLASAVTYGGGITTDVARRILLDQYHESGRYHVAIDELICNKKAPTIEIVPQKPSGQLLSLLPEKMKLLADQVIPSFIHSTLKLTSLQIETLIEAAILAPSGGNAQPWKWLYKDNLLYLFFDKSKSDVFLDYKNIASYIGLGAAIENLILKTHELGFDVSVYYFPSPENPELIAIFSFYDKIPENSKVEPKDIQGLSGYIANRCTNRLNTSRQKIEPEILDKVSESVTPIDNIGADLITDESSILQIGEILAEVEKIRLLHKKSHSDFIKEIRWSDEEASQARDGIDLRTVHLSPAEKVGFQMIRDWEVAQKIIDWKGGNAFKKVTYNSIIASSAIGVITSRGTSPADYLQAGRALEKLWLTAHKSGLALHPITTSVFLFKRLRDGSMEDMNDSMIHELRTLKDKYETLLRLDEKRNDVFLFRLFKAGPPLVRSYRIPIEKVFFST
jgi:tRNA A37 threonylcarbamoyladenosine dehydratase